ncbi:hypothetical protein BDA99DRAFT_258796 [Phascolomyces articulosus]|uniref:Uncharacterized protein n=1 Tax=Phascolomyces articulosus TaxID=60185 RepID=A0AAD5P8P9_9FUNG|nr:hypothetical protein BDA99DRAFT_258796 [Phascolomyces articulosus]
MNPGMNKEQIQLDNEENGLQIALAPLFTIFSLPQLESILYAFLPSRIEQHIPKSNIYAVDTFVVTASVTFILVVARLTLLLGNTLLKRSQRRRDSDLASKGDIAIVIEPTASQDDYHTTPNVFHQALSHLVSQSVQSKANGYYILKPNLEVDHSPLEPPAYNIVPQTGQCKEILRE